jgi:hypothetical protein
MTAALLPELDVQARGGGGGATERLRASAWRRVELTAPAGWSARPATTRSVSAAAP